MFFALALHPAFGFSCNRVDIQCHSQQTDLKTPAPHLVSLNPSQDINIPTSSTSIPRPPVVRQPASAGVAVGEEDDLEARRLRYIVLSPFSVVFSSLYCTFLEVC